MKEKLLVVWLLVVVAFGFLFHQFWSWTVCAFEKVVAFGLVSTLGMAKFAVGSWCVSLLP